MVGLGHLAGDNTGYARDISADGSVIVGGSGFQAARYAGGTVQGLGYLSGGSYSEAYAVSGDGSTIVGYNIFGSEDSSYGEAYVWDAVNGMQNLQAVLQAQGADLTGWSRLGVANGISADGAKIAGVGTYNGVNQAFLAQLSPAAVPEPSGLALVAVGLSVGLWRRRTVRTRAGPRLSERGPAS